MFLRNCAASPTAALSFGLRPIPNSRSMHVQCCTNRSNPAEARYDRVGWFECHVARCSDIRSPVKSPYKQRTSHGCRV